MGNLSFGGAQSQSYLAYAKQGQAFLAQAIVTVPTIFTTAAGTGGPLLWNGSGGTTSGTNNAQVDAVLIGVSFAITTAATTAFSLGLTGGPGQTAAPSSTTAIDGLACTRISAANTPSCSLFRKGTVSAAGKWFLPLATIGTTALTAAQQEPNFVDLQGMIVVPPNSWISLAASATDTTSVLQLGLVWVEISRL